MNGCYHEVEGDGWGPCFQCMRENPTPSHIQENYSDTSQVESNPLYYHTRLENTPVISQNSKMALIRYKDRLMTIPTKIIRYKPGLQDIYVHTKTFNKILESLPKEKKSMSNSLTFFQELNLKNKARQAEWDTTKSLSTLYKAVELVGEVGELCNNIKKIERESLGLSGSRCSRKDLEEEFGDVVITLALLADHLDIDLEEVTKNKFNLTSDKMGFKTRY